MSSSSDQINYIYCGIIVFYLNLLSTQNAEWSSLIQKDAE